MLQNLSCRRNVADKAESRQGSRASQRHSSLPFLTTIFSSPPFYKFSLYMPGIRSRPSYTCARCLRAFQRQNVSPIHPPTTLRRFSQASPLGAEQSAEVERQPLQGPNISRGTSQSAGAASQDAKLEEGAMSRRLAQATEDAVLEGGRAGRRAVEDAGFSEELKRKLLEKVEAHKFRADNASAIAEAGLSSRVGRGSRDIATAREWTGIEMPDDTMLRMLDDARKPLKSGMRGPAKIPTPVVDLRLRRASTEGPGQRLANARDKSSIYAISKDSEMTEKEREDMRRELKERFGPTARAMPNSIRGLAALANERIEDAIARGQFKVRYCTTEHRTIVDGFTEYSSGQSYTT